MKRFFLTIIIFISLKNFSQVDQNQLGAWYIYFYNFNFGKSSFGIQGDVQYRNWNLGGDLEQLLIRTGLTFNIKKSKTKFTLGYANITSEVFGLDNKNTSGESRIYQEILQPHKLGKRIYVNHRLRLEQRFVEGQNFRTRYRYFLSLNLALNKPELIKNAIYISIYDELFINGEENIGNGKKVNYFDRNRAYLALGYMLSDKFRIQIGAMNQTSTISKNQLQLSLHHSF